MDDILRTLIADPNRTNALAAVANVLVAAIALLIATISIFVSWRTLSNQRKHNKLSVRPIPYFRVGDYDNRLIVAIDNHGSGPLIITKLTVSNDLEIKKDIISWMPDQPKSVLFNHFSSLIDGRSIMAGGELVLIDLKGEVTREIFTEFRDECRATLSHLKIEMMYTDI